MSFDARVELESVRAEMPVMLRKSELDPFFDRLEAMREEGAAPRELAAWLRKKGVKRTPSGVSAYLRRRRDQRLQGLIPE